LIACQLWLPRSPDLNPCNFYLWVHKTDYMWTVHILCKNWKTLFKEKLLIFQDKQHLVSRNIFRRCGACLEAGGPYFWDSHIKQGKLNYGKKTDSKSPADAGFQCDNAFVAAAVLRDMINLPHCSSWCDCKRFCYCQRTNWR
jgi:hypothetical protein